MTRSNVRGSEFQVCGAATEKAPHANSVRVLASSQDSWCELHGHVVQQQADILQLC